MPSNTGSAAQAAGLPILITRPQPGASTTARTAQKQGFDARVAPLFWLRAVSPALACPVPRPGDSVLLSSANAVRFLPKEWIEQLISTPALCVGQATARAARKLGLNITHIGTSGAVALLKSAQAQGFDRILWPCGITRTALEDPRLLPIAVYQTTAIEPWRGTAKLHVQPHIILVHSSAQAQQLARYIAETDRSPHIIVAISKKVAEVVGTGWRDVRAAQNPLTAEMLALCREMCQK